MAEPGGLPSMGLHRFGHNWSDLAAAAAVLSIFYSYKKSHRNKINLREEEIVILRLYDGLLRKPKRQKRIIE